jgi:predicted DNA-binding transcriptional regulator AlpA
MQITDPLLNIREVSALIRKSVPSVYRDVHNGIIPKPIKLGGASRWPQSEILDVIERAKAERGVAA